MTIICFDGKTIAADRQVTSGNVVSSMSKLFKTPYGVLGIAGEITDALEFVDWFNKGRVANEYPGNLRGGESFSVLFVDHKKNIYEFSSSPYGILIKDKKHAIGSGTAGALVALHLDKDAVETVKIVSKFDSSCGGGVDSITLGTK